LLKGQGAVTEREQLVLERARSASIDNLTADEITILMNVVDRIGRTQARQAKSRIQRVGKSGLIRPEWLAIYDIDEPGPYQPKQAAPSQPNIDDILKKYQ
jgi:hypothetical protein